MFGYNVKTSRFKRAEDGPIHRYPIDPEVSEVVIVEHQGHEIDALCREFGRNGIGEWSRDSDDWCGRNAVAPELAVTFSQGDGGWTPRGRRHRRRCTGGSGWVAVALWRG